MSFTVENLEEKNMVKLVIESTAEEFEAGLNTAYNKNKSKISLPGFRKGKAPRKMIEKMYGAEVFYEDAANSIIPDAYAKAADECGLELVSQPKINVTQLEAGKPFIFEAVVATKPEVELGQYKGVEVTKADTEATDADVEEELKRVQEQNSRTVAVTDRAVKDGDNTVIDFEGFVDGVAFEGGKGTDYPLTIGSHSFIDTFEDQIIGMNIGDEKEINVTFPEEYHVDDLKGKPAMFKVSVKEIKEKQLPELNDEFAQDVSDFDTIAEYKDDLKNKIADRKSREAKAKQEDEAIAKIIEDSKMDIPDAMVDTQVNRMVEDFAQRLQQQGLSVEQYFQYTGMTADKIMERYAPDEYDLIVIFNSDNHIVPNALSMFNNAYYSGCDSIQAHRMAENLNTSIAVLNATSEEINNNLFRLAHTRMGFSSALIGSAMAFDFAMFHERAPKLKGSDISKAMETVLLEQNIYTEYLAEVVCYSKKEDNADGYQTQRISWIRSQYTSTFFALRYLPLVLLKGEWDYALKLFQWLMPSRFLLIALILLCTAGITLLNWTWAPKWYVLLATLILAFLMALPEGEVSRRLRKALWALPVLMFTAVFSHIKRFFYKKK